MGSKSQMLRDAAVRMAASSSEIQRRALLAIARNTSLEASVRHRAQLGLGNMDTKGRTCRVKNRCMETGRGRGIMSEFGLCRVSRLSGVKRSDVIASRLATQRKECLFSVSSWLLIEISPPVFWFFFFGSWANSTNSDSKHSMEKSTVFASRLGEDEIASKGKRRSREGAVVRQARSPRLEGSLCRRCR